MTVQRREQLDLDREAELSKELEEGFDGWEIFRPPEPEPAGDAAEGSDE